MSAVIVEVSLSLDGIAAGRNVSSSNPMGDEGLRLHRWLFEPSSREEKQIGTRMFQSSGAVLMGRRTFDAGIEHWGDDGAFGMPVYVVTNRAHEPVMRTRTRFEFVTGGIGRALDLARAAAGDQDVWIMGSADIARQYLAAGLVDELHIHLAPLVLGQGTRFFDGLDRLIAFDPLPPDATPHATHLRWTVLR